ncbi:MAG: PQQ-binding-like beta-propeller repeat protein [Bacteriovoracaceae bacterium]
MTPSHEFVPMILPTVMIPLTLVSVGISVVASFIAALFGIELKMEGPKKLLEVLLKPKVLITGLLMNGAILGAVHGWKWWKNYPRLISTIESQSQERAKSSSLTYQDVPTVNTNFTSSKSSSDAIQSIEQVWHVQTEKGSFRAAVVANERVFFGNDAGIVRELELNTGKEIRNFYIGTAASSELTIWNNAIYIGEGMHDTHHARVYRFDLKTGQYQGSYQALGHTEAQAVIGSWQGENTLFVVAGSDGLHAVDPVSMQVKWKLNLGHMDAGITVSDGVVYIGTGREKDDDKKNKCFAAALDFKTGKVLWKHELAASSWMRPVVVNENVCYIAGEIYFPSERGHISCFDRSSGNHSIAMNTTDPLAGTPKVLDQSLLYTSIHGLVCRFDLITKKNQWCFDAKMKDFSLAGASYDPRGNVIVYPSFTNGLYVLDPNDGKVLYHWKPSKEQGEWKKTYADITVSGDYWIVSDDNGSVRALRANFIPKTAQK